MIRINVAKTKPQNEPINRSTLNLLNGGAHITVNYMKLFSTNSNHIRCLKTSMLCLSYFRIDSSLHYLLLCKNMSQAAACDGSRYQVAPNDNNLPFIRGVLPL